MAALTLPQVIRQIASETNFDGDEPVGFPCDAFAETVIERFGAGRQKWVRGHCYIEHEGRLYDEAHPEGVE
jgi:hypothetical protein